MEHPRTPLGCPLPVTPKKSQNSKLDALLHQFGSQSSPSSVTKARKVSQLSQNISTREVAGVCADNIPGERTLNQHPYSSSLSKCSSSPSIQSNPYAFGSSCLQHPQQEPKVGEGGGYEDHLRESVNLVPPQQHNEEELKMDRRHRKTDETHRSLRRNNILTSDTAAKKTKKTSHNLPKQDNTARARLREDIAAHIKVKMNNFLLANQQYFLPLLPPQNYITRLAAKHKGEHPSIIEYEELKAQPKGYVSIRKTLTIKY